MDMLSFEAMKFGSENDLRIALTELKYIKETKGKLTNSDFRTVSEKYKFPIDFLKKGLKGFSFPEDYLISKSRWFPIIYSWVVRERELSNNLLKFQIGYYRTKFWSTIFLSVLGAYLLQSGFILQNIFELGWLQLLSIIAIPFTFFFISLCIALKNNIANKKMKLDECSTRLKDEGFDRIIVSNEQFIRQNFKLIIYAGGIILKKIQSAPTLQFFFIGAKEEEKPPARFSRLLSKLPQDSFCYHRVPSATDVSFTYGSLVFFLFLNRACHSQTLRIARAHLFFIAGLCQFDVFSIC